MFLRKIGRRIIRGEQRNLEGLNGESAYNRINLEYYDSCNIGDSLSPVVYQYMVEHYNLDMDKKTKKTLHISAIGSILSFFNADTTVWGTGLLSQKHFKQIVDYCKVRKLDIRAVRGPITRLVLSVAGYNCPEIYGDPAILMPLIYDKPLEKKYELSYIPHVSCCTYHSAAESVHIISTNTKNYQFFINEIRQSKVIISSSLHGIILAESYGIPAVWLNEIDYQKWKFFDWYYSTERYDIRIAKTLDEARSLTPMATPRLNEMQKKLIEVFPCDLWE